MDIKESIDQILQTKSLLAEHFYTHFFERHPEMRKFFDGVNMKRQAVLLTTALMVIQRHYADPTPAIEQYLEYIGTKHDEMSIPPDQYQNWRESMIEALQKFHDDKWNSTLESQWRAAIDKAIESMLVGYQKHITI